MGEVFAGRYELLDPIAVGGMGTIWRVLDSIDGEVKAAKILAQSDAATLLRFVREQSVRIDHTHVVTPMSWAGMDDRVLFTMPLVRGGSVADLLRQYGALPTRWVALLTDQLLQALEAVHHAGIVHRDVKPGNLLLEPCDGDTPHLRLTDFGIAAPMDEPRMTRASMAIGTPGYMPPEQWYGADPDPRADLFSVGRVALEMLTGERPPAEEEPDLDGWRTLRDGSSPASSRTSRDEHHDALLRVIGLATRREISARPTGAAALRAELDGAGLLSLAERPEDRIVVPDRYPPGPGAGAAAGLAPTAAPSPGMTPAPPAPPPGSPAVPGAAPTVGPPSAPPLPAPSTPPPPPPPRGYPTPAYGTAVMGAGPATDHLDAGATAPSRRPSPLPGALLVLLGLVGLVVSLFLIL